MPEEVEPFEAEPCSNRVEFHLEGLHRPQVVVVRTITVPATELVVEHHGTTVFAETAERFEVIVRQSRSTMKHDEWRSWPGEIALDAVPRPMTADVDVSGGR